MKTTQLCEPADSHVWQPTDGRDDRWRKAGIELIRDAHVGWDDREMIPGVAESQVVGPLRVRRIGIVSSYGLRPRMNHCAIGWQQFRRIFRSNVVIPEKVRPAQRVFVIDVVVHFTEGVAGRINVWKTAGDVFAAGRVRSVCPSCASSVWGRNICRAAQQIKALRAERDAMQGQICKCVWNTISAIAWKRSCAR